jgi:hypothetical protein
MGGCRNPRREVLVVDHADALLHYLNALGDFVLEPAMNPYHHVGATLTDAILQAGLSYETVVRPRVQRVQRIPEASTTTGFLTVIRREGIAEVLRGWSEENRKPKTLVAVLELLAADGVESEDQLREWLTTPANRDKLRKVHGVGPKTIDYLQILVGAQSVAPDVHLLRLLSLAGVPSLSYEEAREIVCCTADRMGVPRATLDHSIWRYMSRLGGAWQRGTYHELNRGEDDRGL